MSHQPLTSGGGGGLGAHAASHQNGGTDEINVAGLSGVLADAQHPGFAAGGVLSGTYPNPGFAVDMATQAELDAAIAAALAYTDAAIAAHMVDANAHISLPNLTTIGTLVAGAVPANLVTPGTGTFGTGAYTFPSTLVATTSLRAGTDPGGSSAIRGSSATLGTGTPGLSAGTVNVVGSFQIEIPGTSSSGFRVVYADSNTATGQAQGGSFYRSSDTDPAIFGFVRTRGTLASPSAVQSGDNLGMFVWFGRNAAASSQGAQINVYALQNWSGGNRGTRMQFMVNPVNDSSGRAVMELRANSGNVTVDMKDQDDVNTVIWATSYGDSVTGGSFIGRSARGSLSAPTASQTGNVIANFGGRPYDGANFATTSRAAMQTIAGENISSTNQGMYLIFRTTAVTTTTTREVWRMEMTGALLQTLAVATLGTLSATQFSGYASTVSGAVLHGYGTTGDVTLKNRAGNDALYVVANSTNVAVVGSLFVATVDSNAATDVLIKRSGTTIITAGASAVTFGVNTVTNGNADWVFQRNTSTVFTLAQLALAMNLPVRLKGYTVAALPAGTVGDLAYATDLLGPAFGATAVGGGAVKLPVFYDGANWVVT